jgi:restriction system protein
MNMNCRIWRLRLGSLGTEAEHAFSDGSAGVGFDIPEDLSGNFPEEWRDFNASQIPGWLERNPDKSRIAAGLACAAVWRLG